LAGRYARGDGRSGFASAALGRDFRAAAYRAAGLPLPGVPPRTLTLLSAVDGEEARPRPARVRRAWQGNARSWGPRGQQHSMVWS